MIKTTPSAEIWRCLNPLYIVEFLLMRRTFILSGDDYHESLNPLYIVEFLLIGGPAAERFTEVSVVVLIHSTSWNLF